MNNKSFSAYMALQVNKHPGFSGKPDIVCYENDMLETDQMVMWIGELQGEWFKQML